MSLEIKEDNFQKNLLLYWDEVFLKKVNKSLFFKDLCKIPQGISKDVFLNYFLELEEKIGKRWAFHLLSQKSYLSHELYKNLISKGISQETANKIIQECTHRKFLDDDQAIKRWRDKGSKRGESAKAVLWKLKRKGVEDSHLHCALAEANSDETALTAWLAKNQKKIDWENPQERKKIIAKLCRKGFSLDLILQTISKNPSREVILDDISSLGL